MNINNLFILLSVFSSSLQFRMIPNQDEVFKVKEHIVIEVYENRLCFDLKCYDIMNVNTDTRTYELKDGSRAIFRDKEIVLSTLKETIIYQDLKTLNKEQWQKKMN